VRTYPRKNPQEGPVIIIKSNTFALAYDNAYGVGRVGGTLGYAFCSRSSRDAAIASVSFSGNLATARASPVCANG
jgi:hypothetical protein